MNDLSNRPAGAPVDFCGSTPDFPKEITFQRFDLDNGTHGVIVKEDGRFNIVSFVGGGVAHTISDAGTVFGRNVGAGPWEIEDLEKTVARMH